MKIFGILCFSILVSFGLTGISLFTGNPFIFEFTHKEALSIASTLIGFNIAIHTILIGQISLLEEKIGHLGFFKKTRSELKQNAIFSVLLLIIIFLLQSSMIKESIVLRSLLAQETIIKINYVLENLILSTFVILLFLIQETLQVMFKNYDFKL